MDQVSNPKAGGNLVRGGIFFLGGLSIVFCLSIVMSVFTPFPLSLATVLYGRVKGLLVSLFSAIIIVFLAWREPELYRPAVLGLYLGSFLTSWLVSFCLSEIILRRKDPKKGITFIAWAVIVFFISTVLFKFSPLGGELRRHLIENAQYLTSDIQKNMNQWVELKGDEVIRESLELLEKPKAFAEHFIDALPKFFLVISFFFWLNLFLLLRVHNLYAPKLNYPFSQRDLLRFKVSEHMIWPFIAGLVLYLGGDAIFGTMLGFIGKKYFIWFGTFLFSARSWNLY